MNPKDRKGKGIAMDDGDETIASIARRRDPPLVRRGFLVEPSKRMRRSVAGRRRWTKRRPLLRPRRWSRWLRWRKRRESPPKPSVGKRLRDRGRGKSMIPATKPTLMKTKSGAVSQARLEGIPDVIKMPSRTPPTGLIHDGRSWMTEEILRDLIAEAEFLTPWSFVSLAISKGPTTLRLGGCAFTSDRPGERDRTANSRRTAKPSRSKKKSMGLRKRAAVPIDDVVVASEPAPKKKRVESPRLRDSPPSPLRSSSIASRTRASTRKASTSVPEGVPEQVIELDSPPSSDHDESSHHDESASHHDDGLRTPARGGSPSKGDEFLTPGGGVPSSDRRDRGGFEGGESSRRPGENDEAVSRHSEAGGFAPGSNLGAEGGAGIPKDGPEGYNPHAFKTWWNGGSPLMEDQDACGGATWMSKVHPGLGIPREELTFRTDFDEAAQHHIMSGGKFTALVQKYETALRAAKDEAFVLRREREMAKDVDTMVADCSRINWCLSRRSVEAAVTQVFDSVNDWYAPRLHRLSEFVAQRDMVEAAVGRRQVDEALLNFVKKIRGVDLNFDAMEEKLAAKLAKSIADGDAIDEVVIDDDDFAPPNSLKRLVLPGSPSRRDGGGADPGAGPSTSGAKSA
ncbi:unnamed protein product [Microthlaspi erraticum]|uniref:Uncharacterized protein n=2 Tax=Microthlaspi erraticum TaxID=1685480 RepID=A0A6D2IK52_9BRAS|nr:unnamed protein product [Microthlaspi erraticum]